MSLCIGICQMDEFGYCTGCGRSQGEIDGTEPPPDPARAVAAPSPHAPSGDPTAGATSQSAGR